MGPYFSRRRPHHQTLNPWTRDSLLQPFDQVDLQLKGAVPLQTTLIHLTVSASRATVEPKTLSTFAPLLCLVEVKAAAPEDAHKDEGYDTLERATRVTRPILRKSNLTTKSKSRNVRRVTFSNEVRVFQEQWFERETHERPTEPPVPHKLPVLAFQWKDVLAEVYGPPLATPPSGDTRQ